MRIAGKKKPSIKKADSMAFDCEESLCQYTFYQERAVSLPRNTHNTQLVSFFNRTLRVVKTGLRGTGRILFVQYARLAYRHQTKWNLLPNRSRQAALDKMFLIQIEDKNRAIWNYRGRPQPLLMTTIVKN